jgi:hypothetical protein
MTYRSEVDADLERLTLDSIKPWEKRAVLTAAKAMKAYGLDGPRGQGVNALDTAPDDAITKLRSQGKISGTRDAKLTALAFRTAWGQADTESTTSEGFHLNALFSRSRRLAQRS